MFESFSRSWSLVQASLNVLRSDKELLIYPLVSMLAMIVVTLVFIIPIAATGMFRMFTDGDSLTVAGVIVLFIFYVVSYTVIFFCNSALVAGALLRLSGGDPTLGYGFQEASKRLPNILGYAVIAATVGMILQAIRERSNLIGRIVVSIIGGAWNLVTFLVVPVLIMENVSPLDAIKRSFELLKKTWGEQIVGNFSIGGVFGLLTLGVALLGGLLIGVTADAAPGLAILFSILLVLALVAIGLLSSALSGIYTAALYRYATDGSVDFFDESLIQGAFKRK
ncbi:MAG: DUF6159 family protein [Chloroflexota bacterium]|nr:DUF6159 family protein [Chloroflexota bacterium]